MLFGLKAVLFELLHAKPGRIIWKLNQKPSFGPEMCEIGPKVGNRTCPGGRRAVGGRSKTYKIRPKVGNRTCPDLPRPVLEDKYLLQTSGNTFIFSDFMKSSVLLNKFITFYKIIGFTK